jgi:DeoR/GlpR family transcriptional regulator of sugar metabolism
MRPRDRQAKIAEIIFEEGEKSVDALATAFRVSVETIRRDLVHLAGTGVLQKVHGGARRLRLHVEGSFSERMAEDAEAKRVIARKTADLVEPGDTLFIDTGSTTLLAAEALARVERLTVITNSVRIAQVFAAGPGRHRVFLVGGAFVGDNEETVGPLAIEQVAGFSADHALVTVAALDADDGAMNSDFDEAQVARAMIGRARHLFVLASRGKFARKAAFRVCALEDIDVVVSDGPPPAEFGTALAKAGVEVR